MPRLPTSADLGNRPIVRAQQPLYQPQGSSMGDMLTTLGGVVSKKADEVEGQEDALDVARANTDFLKKSLDAERQFEQDPDFTTLGQRGRETLSGALTSSASLIRNPALRQRYMVQQESDVVQRAARLDDVALRKKQSTNRAIADTVLEDNKKIEVYGSPEDAATARATAMFALDSQYKNGEITPEQYQTQKDKYKQSVSLGKYQNLDPQKQMDIMFDPTNPKISKDKVIRGTINDIEGGYVAIDGASKAPAIYGINGKAHAKEFAEARKITEEQGEEAGKKYAQDFYAREYWDKNNLDKYEGDVATVLFDGSINHGSAFRKKLIQAADSGATAEQLIDMRRTEYQRLAQSPDYAPSFNGWMNRLKKVEKYIALGNVLPDELSDLSLEQITALKQDAEQKFPAYTVRQGKYHTPEQIAMTVAKYGGPESDMGSKITAGFQKQREEAEKDGFTYVAQSPNVTPAVEAFQTAYTAYTQDPEAPGAYGEFIAKRQDMMRAIEDEQIAIGIPEQKVSFVPQSVVQNIKSIVESENATPQQMIEAADSLRAQYPDEYYGRVLGSLRDAKVNGFAVLASMPEGATRTEFAQAMKEGEKNLAALVQKGRKKGADDAVNAALAPYAEAMLVAPDGLENVSEYTQAVNLMTYQQMVKNPTLDATSAAKKAVESLLPYTPKDGLLVPKGMDVDATSILANDAKAKLAEMDVYLPVEIRNNAVKREINIEQNMSKIRPHVRGNDIVFFWENGNPVLDNKKVMVDSKTGKPQNVESAMIKMPLSDVAALTQTGGNSPVLSMRSELTDAFGRDVNDFYKIGASVSGVQRRPAVLSLGYSMPSVMITETNFSRLDGDQRKKAVDILKQNVAYNQEILKKLPEAKKQIFSDYINKSRDMLKVGYVSSRDGGIKKIASERKPTNMAPAGYKKPPKEAMFDIIPSEYYSQYVSSAGLNYLEMPEWAKE